MKKGMLVILLLSVALGAGIFGVYWFGTGGVESGGNPATVLVTTYDAKGTALASECGFFVGPRRLVVHRHIFRDAERLDGKTLDGRTFKITAVLAEDLNLDTILLATDAAASAAPVLKLTASAPQLGQKLTVLLPPLKKKSIDNGHPAGEVTVSDVASEKWEDKNLFFVDGDIPQEASGSPVVDADGKVVGFGTFLVADGRPIRVIVRSTVFAELMQRADHGEPSPLARWIGGTGKQVKLCNFGRVGRFASWALRDEDYLACSIEWTKAEPSNAEAWMNLEQAYRHLNRLAEAAQAAEKGVALGKSSEVLLFNLAWNYEQAGRLEDAIAAYKECIRAYPDDAGAYGNMGLVCLKLNRNEEALAAFKNAVSIDGSSVETRFNLAFTYELLGQDQAAIDEYARTVKIEPDNTHALLNLGCVYQKLGRNDDAIREYQKIVAIDPNNADAYINLGNACSSMGKEDEAIAHYYKAIAIRPDYALAHRNLANAFGRFGRHNDAAKEAREAIRLDPKYTSAYSDLGWACKQLQQYDDAISAFDKAVELEPQLSLGYEGRGYTYAAQGKKDLAMKNYEVLKTLDPKEAELLLKKINKL